MNNSASAQQTSDGDGSGDEMLAGLAEDFALRYRRGENPTVEEYARKHPALSAQIREVFPAMLLMERAGADGTLVGSAVAGERVGGVVGRYRLLERLGEGGFGVVFMAEQLQPVRRKVALKVIKPGLDTKQVIARFEAERQALALMEHENIAKVLDAGATESGRPYFVMELVRGVPITEYCENSALPPRERLELFVRVCRAVQHAHTKGIIHRDIKPTNVLVTLHDGVPVPKVIDFGIAKATGQQLTERTLFTNFAQMVGTPLYMSPEQAEMSGLDADTRADVYSLGVLLYELLTGTTPVDKVRLKEAAFDEVRRIIREEEPPRPSTRLSTLSAGVPAGSARRKQELRRLGQLVRGELDWIVMKALEKDRTRRYETASGLGRDVERYLRDEAVEACPPSAAYRLRKFARHHRVALAAGLALAAVLLLAVAGLAINNRLVHRQKDKKEAALLLALQEKQRADQNLGRARQAVREYLVKTAEHPLLLGGDFQDLRKELLETAVPFYEQFVRQDSQDPDLALERGRAYDDLGFLRQGMGDLEQAAADLAQAQDVFRRLAERFPDRPTYRVRLAEALNSRAGVLSELARLDLAEKEYRSAMVVVDGLLSEPNALSESREAQARIQGNLGLLLRDTGRLPEAEPVLRSAVDTRQRLMEEQPADPVRRAQLAHSWNNLGSVLSKTRGTQDATEAFEKTLELLDPEALRRLTGGAPEPSRYDHLRGRAWNNLGLMHNAAGRFAKAETAFRESIAVKEKLAAKFPSLPQYRAELALGLNNFGIGLQALKRPEEAKAEYEKAIALYARLVADIPAATEYAVQLAGTYSNVGRLIGDEGQLEESLPWLGRSIDTLSAALRRDGRVSKVRESLCAASWTRAMTLAGLDRYVEALEDWDRAIEVDEGRHQIPLRLRRASNLLNLKQHARAAEDAAAIARNPGATADDLYSMACVYALCAALADADAVQADAYAEQGVAMLRQAIKKGYKVRKPFAEDSDLKALRLRDDFQRLVDEQEPGRLR